VTNPTTYILDGVTQDFEFDEIVRAIDDLNITLDGVAVPQPGNWTVTGLGSGQGVVINYPGALGATQIGKPLRIKRIVSPSQLTDFTSGVATGQALDAEFGNLYSAVGDIRGGNNTDDFSTLRADIDENADDIADLAAADVVLDARIDATETDIAALESTALLEVGGVWAGEGLRLASIADPSGAQDAATRHYVDAVLGASGAVPGVPSATEVGYPLVATGDNPDTWTWARLAGRALLEGIEFAAFLQTTNQEFPLATGYADIEPTGQALVSAVLPAGEYILIAMVTLSFVDDDDSNDVETTALTRFRYGGDASPEIRTRLNLFTGTLGSSQLQFDVTTTMIQKVTLAAPGTIAVQARVIAAPANDGGVGVSAGSALLIFRHHPT